MAFSITTRITVGEDRGLFERAANNLRRPRDLFLRVGVLGMSSGLTRLLKQGPDVVRSGRLTGALRVSNRGGGGNEHTIFEAADRFARVGVNLPYARQVQEGGTIEPDTRKALAIPVTKRLKRSRLWPSQIDPARQLLKFVPRGRGGKPNVIGYLVDPTGRAGHGKGVLFALASSVYQWPRPFLFWSQADRNVIATEIFPAWLRR